MKINKIIKNNGTVKYSFEVDKNLKNYFSLTDFFVEYQENIENVPDSILVIPFVCNLLPLIWLCDATLYVDTIDEDFYNQIENIKDGYVNMFPDLKFKGKICAKVEKNVLNKSQHQAITLFSGGIDAFHSYLSNKDKSSLLVSIWGADVDINNNSGWDRVQTQLDIVSENHGCDVSVVKSSLRKCYSNSIEDIVKPKYLWWHDMQHGIALISHVAPLAYLYGAKIVYIASSFTESQKGQYVCASDPTIDNHMKFCGASTVHFGYDTDRINKVKFICEYAKTNNSKLNLRVCWKSPDGNNCCACEKCCRTILSIVALGYDPNEFGFIVDDKVIKNMKKLFYREIFIPQYRIDEIYISLRKLFNQNNEKISNIDKYKWFLDINWMKFNSRLDKLIYTSYKYRMSLFKNYFGFK